MLPKFKIDRLILKPRTIDDLESCAKMDMDPKVTEYIPREWNGSHEHIIFKIAGINQIVAHTHSANNRSKVVMKRVGLKHTTDFIYKGKTPSSSYKVGREEYY